MTTSEHLFEMNAHGDIWQEPQLFDQLSPSFDVDRPAPTVDGLETHRRQGGGRNRAG